jgi:NAD(P)-dependent dehydrogenase (short-subunit alcohol dehydrogenase family)
VLARAGARVIVADIDQVGAQRVADAIGGHAVHLDVTDAEEAASVIGAVGGLDLLGVAAWPWRTPSGYEGLTLLFWDPASASWNTWSDARPRAFAGGFSAVARYPQPGPWEGAESPAQLARSRFRLMQAKRNRWGRLSSSAQSLIVIAGINIINKIGIQRKYCSIEDTFKSQKEFPPSP